VTLLWALKNDGKDKAGFGDVVHMLAAGRTSLVVDPTFDKAFYKLAGFRILGRRAVRVDILERLADLIRPALAWKPGIAARPDGAFDGGTFFVTPAMMSILGANGDDMQEILKGLGYRAEPKPAAVVKARVEAADEAQREAVAKAAAERAEAQRLAAEAQRLAAEAAASEAEAPTTEEAPSEAASGEAPEAVSAEAEPAADISEHQAETAPVEAVEGEAGVEIAAEDAVVAEVAAAAEEISEAGVAEIAAVTVAAEVPSPSLEEAQPEPVAAAEPVEASSEAKPEAEEPKPILLWRQARFENRQRHQRQDHRSRNAEPRADGAAAKPAPHRFRRDDKPAEGAPKERFDRGKFKGKSGKPPFSSKRPDGQANRGGDRPGFEARQTPREDRAREPREERPVRFDPDSPFAKLAALRDQLKK